MGVWERIGVVWKNKEAEEENEEEKEDGEY